MTKPNRNDKKLNLLDGEREKLPAGKGKPSFRGDCFICCNNKVRAASECHTVGDIASTVIVGCKLNLRFVYAFPSAISEGRPTIVVVKKSLSRWVVSNGEANLNVIDASVNQTADKSTKMNA
jgi:hypothetical protein